VRALREKFGNSFENWLKISNGFDEFVKYLEVKFKS
jgi:hypothetical protein